jgi:hypothetical protein
LPVVLELAVMELTRRLGFSGYNYLPRKLPSKCWTVCQTILSQIILTWKRLMQEIECNQCDGSGWYSVGVGVREQDDTDYDRLEMCTCYPERKRLNELKERSADVQGDNAGGGG